MAQWRFTDAEQRTSGPNLDCDRNATVADKIDEPKTRSQLDTLIYIHLSGVLTWEPHTNPLFLGRRGITVKKSKKVNPSRWGFAHISPLPCYLYFLS